MLVVTKEQYTPCSGGWPALVYKEWEVEGEPDIKVICSYYRGFDAQPLGHVGVQCEGFRQRPLHDMDDFKDKPPSDLDVEILTRQWLRENGM